MTWADEVLTCILTSLKCFIEFRGGFFEPLYASLFLERLLGKCKQCFLTNLDCFLSVHAVRVRWRYARRATYKQVFEFTEKHALVLHLDL